VWGGLSGKEAAKQTRSRSGRDTKTELCSETGTGVVWVLFVLYDMIRYERINSQDDIVSNCNLGLEG
jgi:hypothetical protein